MGRGYKGKEGNLTPVARKLLEHLQQNLKLYREEKKITQVQLAEASGLHVATIAGIEQGDFPNLRFDTYASIVQALNLSKDPLVLLKKPE